MKLFIQSSFLLVFVLSMSQDLYANGSIINDDSFYYLDTPKTQTYFPRMELYLGDAGNGQKIDLSNLILNLRVVAGEILPKKASIQIEKWIVSIDGSSIPFSGNGNTLSKEVIKEIKQAKESCKITISVIIYDFNDSTTHRPTTSIFLANPKTN